ncbi:MAG: hypothetical protein JWL73_3525 [Actinomycetia bacterium]|nr:hypothetical protein [Actinomycetes bacterium]
MIGPGACTIFRGAARIDGFAWIELRLSALTGAWIHDEPDDHRKLRFATDGGRHAGHAQDWLALRPLIPGYPREALPQPPWADAARTFATFAATAGDDRIGAYYGVLLPWVVSTYRAHLDDTSPVADGPVRRVLTGTVQGYEHVGFAEGLRDVPDGLPWLPPLSEWHESAA